MKINELKKNFIQRGEMNTELGLNNRIQERFETIYAYTAQKHILTYHAAPPITQERVKLVDLIKPTLPLAFTLSFRSG
jgi:hypothetical protein